jgi:ABC-2 type transport system ATP-binding protein
MLSAADLWKSYGAKAAVCGVSLEVAAGEIVGLLGPNGAGKSTTVAMLCGLTRPDRGSVAIAGEPVGEDQSPAKRRIGLVPQDISLFEELSARANLELFGALYGLERDVLEARAKEALELVGLADRAVDKPSTFSGGMKRRLNIACALVHDPDVLLLDEPTAGVDPQSRNAIFQNLEFLRARGKALVYTTHYMEEAERLCDRVVVIDHGQVVASGTQEALHAMVPPVAARWVEVKPSLEDVFLHLTGRQLRD